MSTNGCLWFCVSDTRVFFRIHGRFLLSSLQKRRPNESKVYSPNAMIPTVKSQENNAIYHKSSLCPSPAYYRWSSRSLVPIVKSQEDYAITGRLVVLPPVGTFLKGFLRIFVLKFADSASFGSKKSQKLGDCYLLERFPIVFWVGAKKNPETVSF